MLNKIEVVKNFEYIIKNNEEIKLDIKKSSVISLIVNNNVSVNIMSILNNIEDIKVVLNIEVLDDGVLNLNNIDITQHKTDIEIVVNLHTNSKVNINNIIICDSKKSYYNIRTINEGKKSEAFINQKAVVKNVGEVILNAKGEISKFAINSQNFQENRILLLNEASLGEASPILLINNYEVKAGHKATVSKVDEDSLYYLQTRGISKVLSEKLLTQAFIKSILDEMNLEENQKEEILNRG